MQQEAIYFRGCYDSVGYLKKAVILQPRKDGIGVELMPSFYIAVEIEKI